MSTQTLPLSAPHFDSKTAANPEKIADKAPKSLLQRAFEAWVRPYENVTDFLPLA
ncbi:hypothetical protein RGU70_02215 [Herbaspirillum sp. RTI4]|uniref:hypothetical protein n=1 Tax=Herbaspirillum sp. RTI4 TaxID=3048640 RepID=UPI002AB44B27|nr:hypothetical protein [Herbaspirillum sp. RTI4]MDY7577141.1 hypothetical protein [Herbaspirillum sp. RTI4]MEA9980431.1 hypothetical protein [Herbaspirillum sp. RTI4]